MGVVLENLHTLTPLEARQETRKSRVMQDLHFMRTMLEGDIKRNGRADSFMIQNGLLLDIFDIVEHGLPRDVED